MKYNLVLISILFVLTVFMSCKKDDTSENECSPNAPTVRVISNKQAIIKLVDGKYYIVEDGAIDNKLIPCTLSPNFQVNNLQVTISGDVKLTLQKAGEPCCIENFVIKDIF